MNSGCNRATNTFASEIENEEKTTLTFEKRGGKKNEKKKEKEKCGKTKRETNAKNQHPVPLLYNSYIIH